MKIHLADVAGDSKEGNDRHDEELGYMTEEQSRGNDFNGLYVALLTHAIRLNQQQQLLW